MPFFSMPSNTASRRPVYVLSGEGLKDVETEMLALFVELAQMLALPRSYGEIYGLLFVATRPLSFTDIYERLELSKGAVSLGLQALRSIGAVLQAEGPDWRRDHFIAEIDLRKLTAGLLNHAIQPQLRRGLERIDSIKSCYGAALAGDTKDARIFRERLEKLACWHRKGEGLFPMVTSILA